LFPSKEDESEQVSILQSVADEFAKKFQDEKIDEIPISFLYTTGHRVDSQVSEFLGISKERPALRIINIPKRVKYKFSGAKISADTLTSFVKSFLEDKLSPVPVREKET